MFALVACRPKSFFYSASYTFPTLQSSIECPFDEMCGLSEQATAAESDPAGAAASNNRKTGGVPAVLLLATALIALSLN